MSLFSQTVNSLEGWADIQDCLKGSTARVNGHSEKKTDREQNDDHRAWPSSTSTKKAKKHRQEVMDAPVEVVSL